MRKIRVEKLFNLPISRVLIQNNQNEYEILVNDKDNLAFLGRENKGEWYLISGFYADCFLGLEYSEMIKKPKFDINKIY